MLSDDHLSLDDHLVQWAYLLDCPRCGCPFTWGKGSPAACPLCGSSVRFTEEGMEGEDG